MTTHCRWVSCTAVVLVYVAVMSGVTGCTPAAVIASKLPPPTVKPLYTGFANERVGVLVWVDRGLAIDYPALQLDIGNAVQAALEARQEKKKIKVLEGTTFPVRPASILRYLHDHPESQSLSVVELAPKLTVSRLIYIEIEDFTTRSSHAVDLFRGLAQASIKVVEVAPDGSAKIGFEQSGISAVYPPKSPAEGVPNLGDRRTYYGTVERFSTEVVNRFVPHPSEEP